MEANIEIRPLTAQEIKPALELVWTVFEEFEAPEYSPEGTQHFKEFIEYDSFLKNLADSSMTIYGCFQGTELLGVLALRGYSHISLLFVQKAFHRQGIASRLCRFAFEECRKHKSQSVEMTVNSSPYAVDFYHSVGFHDTSEEQTTDSIRYVPMKYKL